MGNVATTAGATGVGGGESALAHCGGADAAFFAATVFGLVGAAAVAAALLGQSGGGVSGGGVAGGVGAGAEQGQGEQGGEGEEGNEQQGEDGGAKGGELICRIIKVQASLQVAPAAGGAAGEIPYQPPCQYR